MISTSNLSKIFSIVPINPFRRPETTVALRDVTLDVEAGEVVALVGRNGAGKTTLLKVLCGLFLPDGGHAEVCGLDVTTCQARILRRTGLMVGGERSMYWRLSGRENLYLFGALQDVPRLELPGRIDRVLTEVGLSARSDSPVRSYSSGMRQRLSLARALLNNPEVLLLDEPTRGMDPAMQSWFVEHLRGNITAGNRTVLFATHSLEEAVQLGGKTIIIDMGRIEYTGRPPSTDELREIFVGICNSNRAGQWTG